MLFGFWKDLVTFEGDERITVPFAWLPQEVNVCYQKRRYLADIWLSFYCLNEKYLNGRWVVVEKIKYVD